MNPTHYQLLDPSWPNMNKARMSNQSQPESGAWNDWLDALRMVDAAHERARRAEAAYLAACDRSARAPSLAKASPEPSAAAQLDALRARDAADRRFHEATLRGDHGAAVRAMDERDSISVPSSP